MTPHLLRLIVRRLSDDDPDEELVRRFVAGADDAAFASLVRRHSATVWAACRHLLPNPADAEDAFQATFVALARSAKSVRQPAAVGAWLHATAVRIALNLRRSTARRRHREHAAATREAAPSAVPDAAWHAALAAAHEEAAKLPEALRTAFVLCDLEGVSPADAAARLGWKPGTLTGRLTRARQTLLDRLSARGLAPLAVGVGVLCSPAAAPARLIEAAANYANPAGVIPASLLTLAKGATEMARTKLLAAAVILSGGLLIPGGALLRADGDPPTQAEKQAAQDVYKLHHQLSEAERKLAETQLQIKKADEARKQADVQKALLATLFAQSNQDRARAIVKTLAANPQWEFTYYAPIPPITLTIIEDTSTQYGLEGWEFAGTVKLGAVSEADRKKITFGDPKAAGKIDPPTVLVFKRPTKAAAAQNREDAEWNEREKLLRYAQDAVEKRKIEAERADREARLRASAEVQKKVTDRLMAQGLAVDRFGYDLHARPASDLLVVRQQEKLKADTIAKLVSDLDRDPKLTFQAAYTDFVKQNPAAAKTVGDQDAVHKMVAEAMAKKLNDRLGGAKPAEKTPATKAMTIGTKMMPNGADATGKALLTLATTKFGPSGSVALSIEKDGSLTITGSPEVIDWLLGIAGQFQQDKPTSDRPRP